MYFATHRAPPPELWCDSDQGFAITAIDPEPPEAASACSHFLGDDDRVERPMQMLGGVLLATVASVALVSVGILATAV